MDYKIIKCRVILPFVIISILLFGARLMANNSLRLQFANGSQQFVMLYQDGEIWRLEVYEVLPGRLQEKVKSLIFPNFFTAKNEWQKYQNQSLTLNNYKLKSVPLVQSETDSVLWQPKNAWSMAWEERYFTWVRENLSVDFFEKYKIATDCADAAVILRWIFAREYKLPVGNSLAATGLLFTHESMKKEWVKLPVHEQWFKDQRFLKALEYLMNNTYTKTIRNDSYPIAIDHKYFQPGVFHLNEDESHTRIIATTNYDDDSQPPVILYWSNLPRIVRPLATEIFINFPTPTTEKNGFRLMKWVVGKEGSWKLKKGSDHPGYSLEQIEMTDNFSQQVFDKLKMKFVPRVIVQKAIEELVELIDYRIQVVNDGWSFCKKNDCSFGTSNWEDWSTPSRDKRLLEKEEGIKNLVATFKGFDATLGSIFEMAKASSVWTIENVDLSLERILLLFSIHATSSEPSVHPKRRWAVDASSVALNIIDKTEKSLKLREQKIPSQAASKACPTRCEIGSDRYNTLNTIDEDAALLMSLYIGKAYCAKILKNNCEDLNALMRKKTRFSLKSNESLKAILEKIPWLTSDPNLPFERRWGAERNSFARSVIALVHDHSFHVSNGFTRISDYILHIPSGEKFALVNANTDENVNREPNVISLHPRSRNRPFYFVRKPDENLSTGSIDFFDLSLRTWVRIHLDKMQADSHLYWFGEKHLFIFNQFEEKYYLYQLHSSDADLVGSWTNLSLPEGDSENANFISFFVAKENNDLFLVTENSVSIQRTLVKIPNLDPSLTRLHKYYDGVGSLFFDNILYFIDTKSGQHSMLPSSAESLRYFDWFTKDFVAETTFDPATFYPNNFSLLRRVSDLTTEPILSLKNSWFAGFDATVDATYLLLAEGLNETKLRLFRMADETVTEIKSDGEIYDFRDGSYVSADSRSRIKADNLGTFGDKTTVRLPINLEYSFCDYRISKNRSCLSASTRFLKGSYQADASRVTNYIYRESDLQNHLTEPVLMFTTDAIDPNADNEHHGRSSSSPGEGSSVKLYKDMYLWFE